MMANENIIKKFGIVVRRLRTQKGLSQEEFAELCGLHRTYIGAIERSEKRVTITTAFKIAKALDISLSELFVILEKEGETQE